MNRLALLLIAVCLAAVVALPQSDGPRPTQGPPEPGRPTTSTSTSTAAATSTGTPAKTSTASGTSTSAAPTSTESAIVEKPPNPDEVFIEDVTYGGSGCPAGSASVAFNPTRTTFTILFDKYIASAGPGILPTEARKYCQINSRVHLPNGYQYSFVTVDYRGFVRLDAGITAFISTNYYFGGELEQVQVRSPFKGAILQDYTFRDTLKIESLIWSPCGVSENINANTQIFIDTSGNSTGTGLLTTDSVDQKVKQVLGLVWRPCKQ